MAEMAQSHPRAHKAAQEHRDAPSLEVVQPGGQHCPFAGHAARRASLQQPCPRGQCPLRASAVEKLLEQRGVYRHTSPREHRCQNQDSPPSSRCTGMVVWSLEPRSSRKHHQNDGCTGPPTSNAHCAQTDGYRLWCHDGSKHHERHETGYTDGRGGSSP